MEDHQRLDLRCATLVLLYSFSSLYHSFRGRSKDILRNLDHQSIYLLIVDYSGFENLEDMKHKTFFLWSHGDLFLLSLKKFPWLKKKTHICGLGSTLDTIAKHIPKKTIIAVYNYKEWKKKWTQ